MKADTRDGETEKENEAQMSRITQGIIYLEHRKHVSNFTMTKKIRQQVVFIYFGTVLSWTSLTDLIYTVFRQL